eukprot:TRINITY_DN16420_c0_g1_i1.p2 TRINITY_DN16420_c0_g1~~TRINITY_DN16420_c0_g1_i1.p2  ORF type:complete len:182 (+),score=56.35 TRINITY_DN16420_c0_g1_i1:87-632(+)
MNLFKGIGFIQKILKNKIKWIGAVDDPGSETEIKVLRHQLEDLMLEESNINDHISELQKKLEEIERDEDNTKYAYVTHDDLSALQTNDLDEIDNDVIGASGSSVNRINNNNHENEGAFLVIHAPKGTTLEVPNWDVEGMQSVEYPYRLFLNSRQGEISVYVVSDYSEAYENRENVASNPEQ